jgi:hypothetical protein
MEISSSSSNSKIITTGSNRAVHLHTLKLLTILTMEEGKIDNHTTSSLHGLRKEVIGTITIFRISSKSSKKLTQRKRTRSSLSLKLLQINQLYLRKKLLNKSPQRTKC